MYVTNDIPNVPLPLLLGNDVLKIDMVTISYTGGTRDHYPEMIFKTLLIMNALFYFESCKLLYTCEAS
jgi:hypothetical protein